MTFVYFRGKKEGMAKQVCDIARGTGMSRGQSTEHLRNYKVTDPDAKKYGFYDPTRMGLNFEIGKGGVVTPVNRDYPIDKRIKDNMAARGIEMPKPIKMKDGTQKERTTHANIILGGSRDRMLQLAFGDQHVDPSKGADNRHIVRQHDIEEWARDQYNLMCRLYGEDNIVAFVVHLDEKNPHVHCTVIPVKDGKISYNSVIGGKTKEESREKFKETHDAVAAVNARWGLERGDNINVTGAKHRTSEEYLTDLRRQCNRLEEEKGTLRKEVTGLKDSVRLLEGEIRRNEIKLKGLTTMYNNKLTVIGDLESQRQNLEDEVLSGEYNLQEIEKKKNKLDTQIQNNLDFLERKRREIEETQKLLDELKKEYSEKLLQVKETDEKISSLRRQITQFRYNDTLNQKATAAVTSHLIMEIPRFFNQLKAYAEKNLGWGKQIDINELIEGSSLFDFTEQPDKIIEQAVNLFIGGTGDAGISSGGGGGGGSQGGWRKKDNEDEDSYLRRCVAMSFKFSKKSRQIGR